MIPDFYVLVFLFCHFSKVANLIIKFAIQKYGGIYLDTDVELIKSLDAFLKYNSFFAMEEAGNVATGLGFGSIKSSEIIGKLKHQYDDQSFFDNHKENLKTCVEYSVPIFKDLGIINKDETQYFDQSRIAVFATDVFCPQSLETGKTTITSETVSIHHYDSSWKKHPRMSRYFTKYKIRIRKSIDKMFGCGTYDKIKKYVKR
jgi:mannosyltransferase OCH1-like enzyme